MQARRFPPPWTAEVTPNSIVWDANGQAGCTDGHLTSPYLTLPHLTLPYLTLPYLTLLLGHA
jgi:hypothetical protein